MSIQAPESAAPAAPAAPAEHEGPLERLMDHIHPRAEHAEHEISALAGDMRAALLEHRAGALDFAGDVLTVLKLVDPADAGLATAVEGLLMKAVTIAGSAGKIAAVAVHAAA